MTSAPRAFQDPQVKPAQYVAEHPNSDEPLGFSGGVMQSGSPIDPGQGDDLLDPLPEYEESYDLDAPAITASSGSWVRNGHWYTQQSAVYMERSANTKNSIRLAADLTLPTILLHDAATLQIPIGLGFQPGIRSTIGRYLGRDPQNRDHSVEFTFLGLQKWHNAASLSSANGAIISDIDPGRSTPAFNFADSSSFATTSTFSSYELNYRIDKRLSRDRIVYSRDSTWVREATPALLHSVFGGIRGLMVDESLLYASHSTTPTSNGAYNVATHNRLVGLQAGGDFFYEHYAWRAGVRVKGGGFVNWASQESQVRILDANGTPLVPNRNERATANPLAVVVDISLLSSYQIRPNFAFRASYDFIFIGDMALAQNQLTFNPSTPPGISSDHLMLIQGASIGFELLR